MIPHDDPAAPVPSMRVLVQCPACRRQFDATPLKPGASLRCVCGTVVPIDRAASHEPRVLRCGSCGAPLQADPTTCGHCGSGIAPDDRRRGAVCPACFARLPSGARFCIECATEIRPEALVALPDGVQCPRCRGDLAVRAVEGGSLIECAGCEGIFVDPTLFAVACSEAARRRPSWAARRHEGPRDPHRVAYLPCILCGELMQRRQIPSGSGVIVDHCGDHGIWLDRGEIERTFDFLARDPVI